MDDKRNMTYPGLGYFHFQKLFAQKTKLQIDLDMYRKRRFERVGGAPGCKTQQGPIGISDVSRIDDLAYLAPRKKGLNVLPQTSYSFMIVDRLDEAATPSNPIAQVINNTLAGFAAAFRF